MTTVYVQRLEPTGAYRHTRRAALFRRKGCLRRFRAYKSVRSYPDAR